MANLPRQSAKSIVLACGLCLLICLALSSTSLLRIRFSASHGSPVLVHHRRREGREDRGQERGEQEQGGVGLIKHASDVHPVRRNRFLEVPQIVWGLNNQKIAVARAVLTARYLNRTLLMPQLSGSLFYKEAELLQPLPFDRLFSVERFNTLCDGFVAISPRSAVRRDVLVFEVMKGSGRRWTVERDAAQLNGCRDSNIDKHTVIRFVGKHPFLWHDHWSVRDYARIFECLVLVESVSALVDRVVGKLSQASYNLYALQNGAKFESSRENKSSRQILSGYSQEPVLRADSVAENLTTEAGPPQSRYVAVHMRVEKDWMIHCKKTEVRALTRHGQKLRICASRQEIMERVSHIPNLWRPSVIYLAVADVLLEENSLLEGWKPGLVPFEKKRLKVLDLYEKHPYIVQSAIDYEVCLRADIFVGNSFSTFSSLIVLERTMKMLNSGSLDFCGEKLTSYAYNLPYENGPQRWASNLSESSLHSISYGTNYVACSYR